MTEYIDHLQEHFEVPLASYVSNARDQVPSVSAQLSSRSVSAFRCVSTAPARVCFSLSAGRSLTPLCVVTPQAPGFGCDMLSASLDEFEFPNGSYWQSPVGKARAEAAHL